MNLEEEYDQNLVLMDEELQAQAHTIPSVELIHTLVNPRNEHLSLALEMLWRACKPGYCALLSVQKTDRNSSAQSLVNTYRMPIKTA